MADKKEAAPVKVLTYDVVFVERQQYSKQMAEKLPKGAKVLGLTKSDAFQNAYDVHFSYMK